MTPEELSERDIYLELIRDESRAVAEHLRAWLTFQGFLFAAVGLYTGQRLFWLSLVLVIVGALSCWPWYKTLLLSYEATAAISRQYNERKPKDAPGLDTFHITPGQFQLFPEVFIPRVTAFIWLLVFAGLIYYWVFPPSLPAK